VAITGAATADYSKFHITFFTKTKKSQNGFYGIQVLLGLPFVFCNTIVYICYQIFQYIERD